MNERKEKAFEKYFMRLMRKEGFLVEKMSLTNSPGIPDLLCAKKRYSFFLELKILKNKSGSMKKLFRPEQISYCVAHFDKIDIYVLIKYKGVYIFFEPTISCFKNIEQIKIKDLKLYSFDYHEDKTLLNIIKSINLREF